MSPNLQWLAVCSGKGTLHVFSLRVLGDGKKKKDAGGKQSAGASSAMQTKTASNARSSLSFMKGGDCETYFHFLFSDLFQMMHTLSKEQHIH
jgi:hypothetical protein